MIRITSLHIVEFRGIRDLALDLNSDNYGICGPNGTGKSGVVDAIEFCLTGKVTRLSGEGTSELSLRQHGPHVDQRDHPEKAKVSLTAFIPKLGKNVTISRSVKTPREVDLTPAGSDAQAILNALQTHPEFALSRREIVKYIITPPGQRSTDVQTLLRLDHIEKLRKSLTTFANNCKSKRDQDENARSGLEEDLLSALGIEEFENKQVLEKVNDRREMLYLERLTEVGRGVSFTQGLAAAKDDKEPKNLAKTIFRKNSALAELSALKEELAEDQPNELASHTRAIRNTLARLQDDAKALTLARHHGFISTGLELVTEEACPLCDTPWNREELRVHLEKKLLSSRELGSLLRSLDQHIFAVQTSLAKRIQSVGRAIDYSEYLDPAVDHAELDNYQSELKAIRTGFTEFLQDRTLLEPLGEAVTKQWWKAATEVTTTVDKCHSAISGLPDQSKEQDARDFLVVANDRYQKLLRATDIATYSRSRAVDAINVLNHYGTASTGVLEKIYEDVAADFSNYYRVINHDDEEQFDGKLYSAPAKLNFNVDFYGRGLFPPGAYHSEGHQDGMGLCLYLALMKHTLGDDFTFSVLDDVLMSVDTGHRREVCRLLKTEFPNTQFILTTHDRVWLQYMKTENLISSSRSFGSWTVDSGPRVWEDQEIWTEIQSELAREDV